MIYVPTRREGYQLFVDGVVALSEIEQYGIAIDTKYYRREYVKLEERIGDTTERLLKNKTVRSWKRAKGKAFKLGADQQLQWMLYDVLKIECPVTDKEGKPTRSVDKETLAQIKLPFLKDIVKFRQQQALQDKITGILRETVDGVIRPFFNLHLVKTMRSSSDHINFQNQDIRDENNARILRSGFIPRPGCQFGESDYGRLEVCIAACYNLDPVLIEDIINSKRDMHRDAAMDCFLLSKDEVTEDTRYCGKNMFVFPQFYGDYYVDCAKALWAAIVSMKLKTASGVPLRKHLRSKGIRTYEQFEKHIQKVERKFWYQKYMVYREWKERFYERYLECGYIDMLTGFRLYEILKRNEAINRPIQGSAFHCLLWSVIQLVKALRKYKFKSRIIGQIHDSMAWNYHPKEIPALLELQQEIATVRIRKHWPWIIVPLELEAKIAPVGGSWFDMKKVKV